MTARSLLCQGGIGMHSDMTLGSEMSMHAERPYLVGSEMVVRDHGAYRFVVDGKSTRAGMLPFPMAAA